MTRNASAPRQRIVSLWLKRLSTDRVARQQARNLHPLVVFGKRGNADCLVAVNAAAERLGLHPGVTLSHARALHPDLAAVPEDPAADAQLLERLVDWCVRYTPLVSSDAPDGILLDIGGCAHLFGGEQALIDDLAARVAGFGLTLRIAVAGTIGAAWAAARYTAKTIIASGDERALLAPLPLAALRIPAETAATLARVGLKRIGDTLDMPRAPLAGRFGAGLLRQLDRALGMESEPLQPRLPVAPYVAEQRFAEPIAREEDVLAIIERLAARLKILLERGGDGARRIELALFRTDGAVQRIVAGTSRPIRDPGEIRALFVERLAALADEVDPGFGYDMARLSVTEAESSLPEQIGLGGSEDQAELDRLVDRLSARFGAQRVTRLTARDSHIPELASVTVPAQTDIDDDGWAAYRNFRAAEGLSPRPLRLFARPEPIEAIASVPDGPPVRFRWRRAQHEVVVAEGPERIENTWWSEEEGIARDYFRVEDTNGLRFWLYRAGLYRDTAEPRWFMHGLFA
ncbi:MAG TPA: DNA polymerase Y family protein [Pseudolabrys sp.]|nr:DNA polymerase Y family protein [Pseudolabrys sp.]